jgi:hypothetical protein
MSKLIYITESQLQEIIGNGAYLNNQDTTNEYRLGGSEISTNGITGNYTDGDVEYGEPVITDKIAKQITKPRVRGLGGYVERRIVIPESNQDFTGKQNTMQISDTVKKKIENNLKNYNGSGNAQGVKRAQNIVKNGRMSYDDAYRTLNDFQNNRAGDVLDPMLQQELRRKLNTAENISSNNREAKMTRGENVLKSAPKTGAKGGAHTPKGNNVIGITYQN